VLKSHAPPANTTRGWYADETAFYKMALYVYKCIRRSLPSFATILDEEQPVYIMLLADGVDSNTHIYYPLNMLLNFKEWNSILHLVLINDSHSLLTLLQCCNLLWPVPLLIALQIELAKLQPKL
jgi:hypothetical protein